MISGMLASVGDSGYLSVLHDDRAHSRMSTRIFVNTLSGLLNGQLHKSAFVVFELVFSAHGFERSTVLV